MKNVEVSLQHCYGIESLSRKFELRSSSGVNTPYAIYAPNGTMKSSFARTFRDISKGSKPVDRIFPNNETIFTIRIDDTIFDSKSDNPKKLDCIFVVDPYDSKFSSDKMSTLVANEDLKKEYEKVHTEINNRKQAFISSLRKISGIRSGEEIERTIETDFGYNHMKNFFDIINNVNLKNEEDFSFLSEVTYKDIKNEHVEKFLKNKDILNDINEYIRIYDKLIEQSPYLSKAFKLHNAEEVGKSLDNHNFFAAKHSITLFSESGTKECKEKGEMKKIIDQQKEKILNNKDLKSKFENIESKFESIDKKMSNEALRKFRNTLAENREIINELTDLKTLSQKIWKSYFLSNKGEFENLQAEYRKAQFKIKELHEKARNERTDWDNAVGIFNKRFFHMPFELKIENKENAIFKTSAPEISFIYKGKYDRAIIRSKEDLQQVLSTGEQRALYILDIIFEIEARKNMETDTLVILDDICDSFDYKNKYAIVEYIKELTQEEKIRTIILTHNFDFYRTLRSRGIVRYDRLLQIKKIEKGILLDRACGIINPFQHWINFLKKNPRNTDSKKILIALIPFARNLLEYTKGTKDHHYKLLSNVLHYNEDCNTTTVKEIDGILKEAIEGFASPFSNDCSLILEDIFSEADKCLESDPGMNLENKIVLSIACRIKSEKYMKSKICTSEKEHGKILQEFRNKSGANQNVIGIIEKINLMVTENIHINSFMYEPILDMGDDELKNLYEETMRNLK